MDKETFTSPNHHSELSSGDRITCMMYSEDNQNEPILFSGVIEGIRGGGFYGKTLLLENQCVIKLAQPDPFHELLRRVNWYGEPFPSQASEHAALLDHLSMRIAHIAIPILTDGRVRTPQSYGYTHIPGFVFAQVIERMHGCGARFDTVEYENKQFHQIRALLWDLSVQMGLEHGGQIHPDNPFGKPNLWKGNDGEYIWLDLLPAIRHTGLVLPAFYFPFHSDIRQKIGRGEITFNRIHTQKLKTFVARNLSRFTSDEYSNLQNLIITYEKTWNEYNRELQKPRRERVIRDALQRGIINEEYAEKLRRSTKAYGIFFARTITDPALQALAERMQKLPPYKAMFNAEYQEKIRRFFLESNFRNKQFIEKFILYGILEAHEHNLITDDELGEAWEVVSKPLFKDTHTANHLLTTYLWLQGLYTLIGWSANALEAGGYVSAAVGTHPLEQAAATFVLAKLGPAFIRAFTTTAIGAIAKEDLTVAMRVSLLPTIGGYVAVLSDFLNKYGDRSGRIAHYAKRYWIAKFSQVLRPWGGMGTDLEEDVWNMFRAGGW